MSNKNDVILIYADGNRKDIGVLQDYSFDMCFGDSENNFECHLQSYNDALQGDEAITQDYILYIEFTEYGGVIDKITVDSKANEVILSGRSWHGFLNSFVIEPVKGFPYRTYSGEANSVIAQIISDIGMTSWFTVESDNSGVYIPPTTVRYEKAYDCIMSMLLAHDAKLIMWYQNEDDTLGKVHLEAVSRINTGVFEDFDNTQTPYRAGKAYNKVNELICMGQGNGTDRAIIHLYADENGDVLPYRSSYWPMQDSDYYTDIDALATYPSGSPQRIDYDIIIANRATGSDRYVEILDYPNAEIRTNYLLETSPTAPPNWETNFVNYYKPERTDAGDIKYEPLKETYEDKYILTETLYGKKTPPNWRSNYKDFYMKETNSSDTLKKVEDISEEQGATVSYHELHDGDVDPNEWKKYFTTKSTTKEDLYYEKIAHTSTFTYEKVQPVQVETYKYYDSNKPPFDWDVNYGSYYMRYQTGTGYAYTPVTGDEIEEFVVQTKRPTSWSENYGSYYIKRSNKKHKTASGIVIVEIGEYITVSQAISEGLIDGWYVSKKVTYHFPKWKKKAFYTRVTSTVTPAFTHTRTTPSGSYQLPYYKVTKTTAPTFVDGKYYKKVVDTVPPWKPQEQGADGFGGYFEKHERVKVIPVYASFEYAYAVQDRYAELCDEGVKRLKALADKDSLEISLALESNYDVGDIIGSSDVIMGIDDLAKPILRKIVKIKKGILSVNYEVE